MYQAILTLSRQYHSKWPHDRPCLTCTKQTGRWTPEKLTLTCSRCRCVSFCDAKCQKVAHSTFHTKRVCHGLKDHHDMYKLAYDAIGAFSDGSEWFFTPDLVGTSAEAAVAQQDYLSSGTVNVSTQSPYSYAHWTVWGLPSPSQLDAIYEMLTKHGITDVVDPLAGNGIAALLLAMRFKGKITVHASDIKPAAHPYVPLGYVKTKDALNKSTYDGFDSHSTVIMVSWPDFANEKDPLSARLFTVLAQLDFRYVLFGSERVRDDDDDETSENCTRSDASIMPSGLAMMKKLYTPVHPDGIPVYTMRKNQDMKTCLEVVIKNAKKTGRLEDVVFFEKARRDPNELTLQELIMYKAFATTVKLGLGQAFQLWVKK